MNVNYHTSGSLVVEARRPGEAWQQLGAPVDRQTSSGRRQLPATLFPAELIDLRLSVTGSEPNLQVNQLSYEAPLLERIADAEGESRLIAVTQTNPNLLVDIKYDLKKDTVAGTAGCPQDLW